MPYDLGRYEDALIFDDFDLNRINLSETKEEPVVGDDTKEFAPLNINDFIKNETPKEDTRPTYTEVFVQSATGEVRMTGPDQKILEDSPRWMLNPRNPRLKFMGMAFIRDPDKDKGTIYDLSGRGYNWLISKNRSSRDPNKKQFENYEGIINNWLIQLLEYDRNYVAKITFNGLYYEKADRITFDIFGFADEDYVILFYDKAWHKLFYSDGYWESPVFNIADLPKSEVRYMAENGALPQFIKLVAKLNGYNPDEFVCKYKDDRQFIEAQSRRMEIAINNSFGYDSPLAFATTEGIPIDVAVAIKTLTKNRRSLGL